MNRCASASSGIRGVRFAPSLTYLSYHYIFEADIGSEHLKKAKKIVRQLFFSEESPFVSLGLKPSRAAAV